MSKNRLPLNKYEYDELKYLRLKDRCVDLKEPDVSRLIYLERKLNGKKAVAE